MDGQHKSQLTGTLHVPICKRALLVPADRAPPLSSYPRTHERASRVDGAHRCSPRNTLSQRTYTKILTNAQTNTSPPFVQVRVRRVLRGPCSRAEVASTGPCCTGTHVPYVPLLILYIVRGSRVIEPLHTTVPEVTT